MNFFCERQNVVTDEKFGHSGEWGKSPQVGAAAPALESRRRAPKPSSEIDPTHFRSLCLRL